MNKICNNEYDLIWKSFLVPKQKSLKVKFIALLEFDQTNTFELSSCRRFLVKFQYLVEKSSFCGALEIYEPDIAEDSSLEIFLKNVRNL